nr:serine/threonine-protein kinase [uncultured Schaedlerella sp.]
MRYNCIKPIGKEGGFGQVFECEDEYGNKYALKMLKDNSQFGIQRFEREVRLLSRLNHPNIVKIVASNLVAEQKFYVMTLYQCSLSSIIPFLGNDYSRQLLIINSILSGIQYLHSEGVIHRDLKPDNILCNSDTDIVITDFGLGIQINSDSSTMTKTTVFGTYKYCSPEQATNSHEVDYRTDIYSMGKIIEDIVTNYGANQNINPSIKMIIDKCTMQNREDRFSSIAELQNFINNVYNLLMGEDDSQQLDAALLKLSSNQVSCDELIDLALKLQENTDKEKTETFFSNISDSAYQYLERENLVLMQRLIKNVCKYWNQGGWPFSYIDLIADCGSKIFRLSNNVEIKADVLYLIMDLSIYYNRWYAMGVARNLFNEVWSDLALQTSLAMKLNENKLDIDAIFTDGASLPPLINKIYK